jgi:hypothetical protein
MRSTSSEEDGDLNEFQMYWATIVFVERRFGNEFRLTN